ncbi:MAG TPA: homoserine O-acetyltransferase [Thermoanaerobaculia bacterium]|nr:homoserine O-acetyltransferase [Thermoanaerobaculia bacterium]
MRTFVLAPLPGCPRCNVGTRKPVVALRAHHRLCSRHPFGVQGVSPLPASSLSSLVSRLSLCYSSRGMAHPQISEDTFLSAPAKSLVLEEGFTFASGERLAPFTIAYETFGELNADRSNAILACHALSPSAHVAGKYHPDDAKAGWWDGLVGYGKGIDLDHWFVVCANIPGSCCGTTDPRSIDPRTGRPYGSRYPFVEISDMVRVEKAVLDHLGITRLKSIAGGSLGGMQVLMWPAMFPEMVESIIAMAAGAAVPPHGIAWHVIGRKIIENDPGFNGGDYYDLNEPLRGLQIARMVGHMTYLSTQGLDFKFGRRRRGPTRQFEVDSYLEYQGQKFSRMYDANSYIRLQAAMDEMDLAEEYGSLEDALRRFEGRALLISFDTDWLFPTGEVSKVHEALRAVGADSTHLDLATPNGHDAFLIDYPLITPPVREFLE